MGTAGADRHAQEGWAALARADWASARSSFELARAQAETAEVLDGLSQAAHFEGDYDGAIELKELAFAKYRRSRKPVEASNTARWLGFLHGTFHGNFAVASGWMARAERLLDGVEQCAAHGWIILDRAPFTNDTSTSILRAETLDLSSSTADPAA